MSSLPIDTYHLKESSLGRVIKALSKSNHETKENKKICQKLIYQWSSAVLGQPMDYRSLSALQSKRQQNEDREYEEEDLLDEEDKTRRIAETQKVSLKSTSSSSSTLKQHIPKVPTSAIRHLQASPIPTISSTPEKYKKLMGHMQKLKSTASGRKF